MSEEKMDWWPIILMTDGTRVMPQEIVKSTIQKLQEEIKLARAEVIEEVQLAIENEMQTRTISKIGSEEEPIIRHYIGQGTIYQILTKLGEKQ